MSFLGIKAIAPDPGGLDIWSSDHAIHHQLITQQLNTPVSFTGDTQSGSRTIQGVSNLDGLFKGQGVSGAGVSALSTIVDIDSINLELTLSAAATATASGVSLVAGFAALPFFILDPINRGDLRQFLLDHQTSHNFINAALGTVGNDLQDLDINDQNQLSAWVTLNFTEHRQWSTATGVS